MTFEDMEDVDDEEKLQILRNLIEKWVEDELIGKKEVELEDILELRNKLKDSKPRSKLLRLKMILRDIRQNRQRLEDVI